MSEVPQAEESKVEEPQPTPTHFIAPKVHAYQAAQPCVVCNTPTKAFADGVLPSGEIIGWLRVCPTCAAKPAPEPAAG